MTQAAPSKGERTREALIDAAYRQFIANGYHGTSMRQIAEAAGLVVGGIYNHFASKEDIFAAVILARHPLLRALPPADQIQGETVQDIIQNVAHRFAEQLKAEPGLLNLLFIEMVEFEGKHAAALAEIFVPQMMQFVEHLNTARGALRPHTPVAIMRVLVGVLLSYALTEKLIGNLLLLQQPGGGLEAMIDIYLYGILDEKRET